MPPVTPIKAEKVKKKEVVAENRDAVGGLRTARAIQSLGRDGGSAIDDSDDVDSDYAKHQKSLAHQRRIEKRGGKTLSVQDILPFKVVPIILPLSIRDLESVVALQNAAFTDPNHRASGETVCLTRFAIRQMTPDMEPVPQMSRIVSSQRHESGRQVFEVAPKEHDELVPGIRRALTFGPQAKVAYQY